MGDRYAAPVTIVDLARFLGIPLAVALAGVAVAAASHRLMRGRIDADTSKFLDGLAGGALAFVFFLLAFTVADGRERISSARSVVTEEAAVMHQLRRQLGPEAQQALEGYARSVIADEWESMGAVPPRRSYTTDAALAAFIGACAAAEGSPVAEDLIQLEGLRLQRLQLAHASSPAAFWAAIGFLMAIACVLYGAALAGKVRQLALALYLTGFGLVIALVLELERPFAGVVRITPASIADTIGMAELPARRTLDHRLLSATQAA